MPPLDPNDARHQRRIAIAKEIAGTWICAWVLYVLGLIPFGGSAEYAACGFLALLVTMPIFIAAGVYASEPSKVRWTGGYGGRWHHFHRF
jgi:hypothetical protein